MAQPVGELGQRHAGQVAGFLQAVQIAGRDPARFLQILPAGELLFRLFHEDGVRVFDPQALKAACRCSQARILGLLASFSAEERQDMVEADGRIRVSCEFCSRVYEALPSDLDDASA